MKFIGSLMWTPWESDGERWQGQCCVDLLGSSLIILSRIELHFFLWTVMSWTQHWTGSDEKQTWHGEAVSLSRLCPRCLCLKFRTRKLREDGETDGGVARIFSVAWDRPLFCQYLQGNRGCCQGSPDALPESWLGHKDPFWCAAVSRR